MRVFGAVSRFFRWRRGVIAGLLAALAVFVSLHAVMSQIRGDTAVVTCVRAVAAGAVVSEADVKLSVLPGGLIPDAVFADVGDVVGKVAATGLVPRQVLTSAGIVSGSRQIDPGSAVVPISVPEQMRLLLFVGGKVDILTTSESGQPVSVVEDALVVALPLPSTSTFGGSEKPIVLVQVPRAAAGRVAHLSSGNRIGIALR